MLGFCTCFLLYLRDYGLSATFIIPEACSVLPAGTAWYSICQQQHDSYPPTGRPVLLQQSLATQVFLAKYCYVSKCQGKVNKQKLQSSTQRHIYAVTLTSSFCMICCHKFKICTQTVCCGQNVKLDFRFGRQPVSSLTGLFQCYMYISKQSLCNASKLDTAVCDTMMYHMSLIHSRNHKSYQLNHKLTVTSCVYRRPQST